jgi:hypothetical protein
MAEVWRTIEKMEALYQDPFYVAGLDAPDSQ